MLARSKYEMLCFIFLFLVTTAQHHMLVSQQETPVIDHIHQREILLHTLVRQGIRVQHQPGQNMSSLKDIHKHLAKDSWKQGMKITGKLW